MTFRNECERKMWEKCMDLLIEVEGQCGMSKVRKVARQLFEAKLLDLITYELLLFDDVTQTIGYGA